MVYLITCSKTDSCKIGFSNCPENRLSQLQVGNPFSLEISAVIEGNVEDEKRLHQKFDKYKLSGEWFHYSDEIRKFFNVDESFTISTDLLFKIMSMSNPSTSVYFYLLPTYIDDKKFIIDGNMRKSIAKTLHRSASAVANALTELKKEKLLISVDKGMYQINPRYAFKGSTSNRNAALKAIIELGCKDC